MVEQNDCMIQLDNPNPRSKSEILQAIEDVTKKVEVFYGSLSPEIFFHEGLGGWSPAQNLSHITWIQGVAAILLKLPRFLLLPFGKRTTLKDYKTIQQEYIFGSKVVPLGPLAPSKIQVPANAKEKIHSMLSDWRNSASDLKASLESIPESDFDEYSLPHPSMGVLSLREMFFVILAHPIHHSYKVELKIPKA